MVTEEFLTLRLSLDRQEVEELRFEKECLQLQLSQARDQSDWPAAPSFGVPLKPPPAPSVAAACSQTVEMQNEQHVKAKHASIYPTKEDVSCIVHNDDYIISIIVTVENACM